MVACSWRLPHSRWEGNLSTRFLQKYFCTNIFCENIFCTILFLLAPYVIYFTSHRDSSIPSTYTTMVLHSSRSFFNLVAKAPTGRGDFFPTGDQIFTANIRQAFDLAVACGCNLSCGAKKRRTWRNFCQRLFFLLLQIYRTYDTMRHSKFMFQWQNSGMAKLFLVVQE